jgi:dethiobiotin synthetase
VANQLGAVNQALLTLAYAEQRRLQVHQLILSDVEPVEDEVFEQHRRMLIQAAPSVLRQPLPRIVHLRHGSSDFVH